MQVIFLNLAFDFMNHAVSFLNFDINANYSRNAENGLSVNTDKIFSAIFCGGDNVTY